MKRGLIISLMLSVGVAVAHDKGVGWQSIEPFCGNLVSREPIEFPLERSTIRIYRAKLKYVACCDSAVILGIFKVNSRGDFDFRYLTKGEYWMVVSWEEQKVAIPLWWTKKHNFACDSTFYNTIEVRPSAGTAEVLSYITNN